MINLDTDTIILLNLFGIIGITCIVLIYSGISATMTLCAVMLTIIFGFLLINMWYNRKDTISFIDDNIFDTHMLVNIIVNVALIGTFLGIFFFTYASVVEQDIVKKNMKIVANNIMTFVNPLLDSNTKKDIINNLKAPDMALVDAKILASNKKIESTAFMQLIMILIIALSCGFIITTIFMPDDNFGKIIGINLIIVVFIGLTEYTFLHFLPVNYISADTYYVRYIILSTLKTKFIY